MPFIGKNPTAGFATIVKDDFTADGTTTVFTLSKQVATVTDIAVYVGNVRQEPTDAYTVNGTTLTMSVAPATGVNFYVLHIAGTIESSVVPPDGSIGTAKLIYPLTTFSSTGIDDNATSTAMTLDSSGNVLVGTTDSTPIGSGGISLRNDGRIDVSRDGGIVANFDRRTSDGDIVKLYKGGSTVGSIGTVSDKIYIGSSAGGDTFLRLNSNTVTPANSSGADRDATINLGYSGGRFKNLFLSGGVYVGGTTSANYLDDYEEGTWTPAYTFSSSQATITYLAQAGHYVRVGDLVTFSFTLQTSAFSGGSGYMWVSGLPFTAASAGGHAGGGFLNYARSWPSNHNFGKFAVGDSATVVSIYVQNHDATSPTYLYPSDFSSGANNNYLQLTGLYRAS